MLERLNLLREGIGKMCDIRVLEKDTLVVRVGLHQFCGDSQRIAVKRFWEKQNFGASR